MEGTKLISVEKVTCTHVRVPLLTPFVTATETVTERESLIIEVVDGDGICGYGECVAFSTPWYTEETVYTAKYALKEWLLPKVCEETYKHPREFFESTRQYKGNYMAKASVDLALWDLYAKKQQVPLSSLIGMNRSQVEAGIVIATETEGQMLADISKAIEKGYKRYKIKISPGNAFDRVQAVRRKYPDLPLMVDANGTFSTDQQDELEKLDRFSLLMIEQPFDTSRWLAHQQLTKQLATPICLDESIDSVEAFELAIALEAADVYVVKVGRVGGLSEALRLANMAHGNGVPLWLGGMVELGISRAHNVAFATHPAFRYPPDLSETSRYVAEDVTAPPVVVEKGYIQTRTEAGIGFKVKREWMQSYRIDEWSVSVN
ncbi:o-succinylbenzoate synthase [Bacillus fonticola]|uniref:o-succinylbenzoate synthase n=1 Tax=Bacillus fonticola TaxID=2728853 RepID=UPI001474FDEB|nr:o-succinylbenzoate synthase [Bacillus fonticola]